MAKKESTPTNTIKGNASFDADTLKILQAMEQGRVNKTLPFSEGASQLNERGITTSVSPYYQQDFSGSLDAAQGLSESLYNFAVGGAINAYAGFIDNFNYDVEDMSNLIRGEEVEYGNMLKDYTDRVRKSVSRDYPIYSATGGYGDIDHWLQLGQSFGYTGGLIGGALLEQSALTALTTGTGGAAAPVQAASLAAKAKKLFTLSSMAKGALFGSMKGVQEGYLNAMETYNTTLEFYKAQGYDQEAAIKEAAKTASEAYKMEIGPIMALNALQFGLLSKTNPFNRAGAGTGVSDAFEKLANKAFKNIKNPVAKSVGEFVTQGLSEGVEEVFQTKVSQHALQDTKERTGHAGFSSLEFWDQETMDSFISGIGGGVVFGIRKPFKNYSDLKKRQANYGKQAQEFINNMPDNFTKIYEKYEEDLKESNEEVAKNNLAYNLSQESTMKALDLDYNMQSEAAFSSYVGGLSKALKAAKEGDMETLSKYGIKTPEAAQHVADTYEQLINDANNMKATYEENFSRYGNHTQAKNITKSTSAYEYADKSNKQFRAVAKSDLEQNLDYKELDATAKKVVEDEAELSSLLYTIEHDQKNRVTPEQKTRVTELTDRIKTNTESLSELQKGAVNSVVSSPDFEAATISGVYAEKFNNAKQRAKESAATWKDTAKLNKIREEVRKTKLSNAKTKTEAETIIEEAEQQGEVTEQEYEVAETKPDTNAETTVENNTETTTPSPTAKPQSTEKESTESSPRTDKAQQIFKNAKGGAVIVPSEVLFSYSGKRITGEKMDALTTQIKEYKEDLDSELGRGATFEELIKDLVSSLDKETVRQIYDTVVEAWRRNNYGAVDFEKMYHKLLSSRASLAQNGIVPLAKDIVDNAEAEREDAETANSKEVTDKTQPIKSLDQDGQPQREKIEEDGVRKNATVNNRMAFQSISTEIVMKTDANGNTVVARKNISNTLSKEDRIKKHLILDPNKYGVGTELTVAVPKDYMDITVSVYEGGGKYKTMSFRDWVEKNNIPMPPLSDIKNSTIDVEKYPEFVSKVPIIITDNAGNDIAYVHDMDWFNELNTADLGDPVDNEDLMQKNRDKNLHTRQQILTGKSNKITVTDKRIGGGFVRTENGETLKLSEANPDTQFVMVSPSGEFLLNGTAEVFDANGAEILNSEEKRSRDGHIFEVRKGVNGTQFIALNPRRPKISKEVQKTISDAIDKFVDDPNFRIQDLEKILFSFIRSSNNSKIPGETDVEKAKNYSNKINNTVIETKNGPRKLPKGYPYIFTEKGKVFFGRVGTQTTRGNQTLFLNKGESGKAIAPFLKGILADLTLNINRELLASNETVKTYNEDGSVSFEGAYRDFLKETLETNVKSFDVSEEGQQPSYATFVQPVLEFELVGEETIPDPTPTETTKKETEEQITEDKKEVQEKAEKKITKEDKQEVLNIVEDVLTMFEYTESSDAKKALKKEKGEEGVDFSVRRISPDKVGTLQNPLFKIEGLSINRNLQIIDYLFNQLSEAMNYEQVVTPETLKEKLATIKSDYIDIKRQKANMALSQLKSLPETEQTKYLIQVLEKEVQVFEAIETNWDSTIVPNTLEQYKKFDSVGEVQEIYDQASYEKNGKSTVSGRMKRFFRGIVETDYEGNAKRGFLGMEKYVTFDAVDNTLRSLMASPREVEPSFDAMMERLKKSSESKPWLKEVIKRLENASEQVKSEFVYNYQGHSISMRFIMFEKNKDGTYTLTPMDTNSNSVERVLRDRWSGNLKMDAGKNILKFDSGNYVFDLEKGKELLDQFKGWKNHKEIPTQELLDWLGNFGIKLSAGTIETFKKKGFTVVDSKGRKNSYAFSGLFKKSSKSDGVFGQMAQYLEDMLSYGIEMNIDTPNAHPFENKNKVLSNLAQTEAEHNDYIAVNSFRDGKKNIFGYSNIKLASNAIRNLALTESVFRDNLKAKSFNGTSFLLDLLMEDQYTRDTLRLNTVGITSLQKKIKGKTKKSYGRDPEVTTLNKADKEILKLGFFQNLKGSEVSTTVRGFKTRVSEMLFPTPSDKSQALLLRTPVLDLLSNGLELQANGQVNYTPELLDLVYSELVLPELKRIVNHHINNEGKTNVKGYDAGAKIFSFIPQMNNLKDANGNRVIGSLGENMNVEQFEAAYKDEAIRIVEEFLKGSVANKMKVWKENDIVTTTESGQIVGQGVLNNDYMKAAKNSIEMAASDFVINNLIAQANMYKLIVGDPAMYFQNKSLNSFNDGNIAYPISQTEKEIQKRFIDGQITKEQKDKEIAENKDKIEQEKDAVYMVNAKNVLGINISKRMASLTAPGKMLANSVNDRYMQVFLNDYVDHSENLYYLTETLDNNRITDEELDIVRKANQKEMGVRKMTSQEETAFKRIKNKYPRSFAYFSIEATDAQEYVTYDEALDVLWRKGDISKQKADEIRQKIKDGKDLTVEELGTVLQPTKPVYTGMVNDETQDLMRQVYIKTSAFVLLPAMTKNTELDKLRVKLEEFQKKSGKNVRASYQSGNKVGGNTNALTPFNTDGTFNSEISMESIERAAIMLDRENFKIQQEVPNKTITKGKEELTIATQIMKILFGGDVINESGLIYKGKEYTGKELLEIFNSDFDTYVQNEGKILKKKLGLDDTFNLTVSKEDFIKRLSSILKQEAIQRDYNLQDIEALDVVEIKDEEGNVIDYDFTVPLYLTPNSDKFQSMLNSIVVNKFISIKVPGYSYVVGSEAGFKLQDTLPDDERGRTIYTENFDGTLRAYTADGQQYAQVLIPSKFRDNRGNLIEFFDKNGNPNERYVEKVKGKYVLKSGMIADELLKNTGFRIPTSDFVSAAYVEVVGFLPQEVGDLMIVPKNFTTQKGLDFDVDKENLYMLHTNFDPRTGKISVFEESDMERILDELELDLQKEEYNSDKLSDIDEKLNDMLIAFGIVKADEIELFEETLDYNPEQKRQDKKQKLYNKLGRTRDELAQKILQNNFVRVHNAVLGSHNPEIQKKINSVLSIDFAKDQSREIQQLVEANADLSAFSILNDDYQDDLMEIGSVGKMGIGVYSNYVVFNTLSQQQEEGAKMVLLEENEPLQINIGGIKSDGTIGRKNTLKGSGSRQIAEVYSERQNIATDNAKEQVMALVNINADTIGVDSILTLLGYDKIFDDNGNEMALSFYLLSQPIIKEYVDLVKKSRSSSSDSFLPENEIISKLFSKYKVDDDSLDLSEYDSLTGQELKDNLTQTNTVTQRRVLDLFLRLKDQAEYVQEVQRTSNLTSQKFGLSILEANEKYVSLIEKLIDAGSGYSTKEVGIANLENFYGDIILDTTLTDSQISSYIEDGYELLQTDTFDRETSTIITRVVLVKPNNPTVSMALRGLSANVSLWNRFYAQTNPLLSEVYSSIQAVTGEKVASKEMIFKEFKKFMVSNRITGLFEGNAQENRKDLFTSTENSKSLGQVLSEILSSTSDQLKPIRDNKLLSQLKFNVQGNLHKIEYNNSTADNFDERHMYTALVELMEMNIELPSRVKGEAYDSTLLAQELIAYSFLSGGVQQAREFHKYVPTTYLREMGFSQKASMWADSRVLLQMIGFKTDFTVPSRFELQFFLNNSHLIPTSKEKDFRMYNIKSVGNKSGLMNIESFNLSTDQKKPILKFKDSQSTYIFRHVGNGRYVKANELGYSGVAEYDLSTEYVESFINDAISAPVKMPTIVEPTATVDSSSNLLGDLDTNDLGTALDNLVSHEGLTQEERELARVIRSALPRNYGFVVEDLAKKYPSIQPEGAFNPGTNTVEIDESLANGSSSEVARVILHEATHAVLSKVVKDAQDSTGALKEDAPQEIRNLNLLLNRARAHFGTEFENAREQGYEGDGRIMYGLSSLNEFIAEIMSNAEFRQKLSVPYNGTNKTFIDKISEYIAKVLSSLSNSTISYDAVANVLSLANVSLETNSDATTEITNDPFGTIIPPSEMDDLDIEPSLKKYKCKR